tara:strand:+ start:104 stop:1300 length:1197 start_codon:yes stop_codon:yes gene_type:complete
MIIIKIFILLIFFSCGIKKKNQDDNKKSKIVDVSIENIYDYNTDLFNISIKYKISNDHFVFIRGEDSFKANVITTIQLFDNAKDSIVMQESWKDTILEKFYDETRSTDRMLEFSKQLSLSKGTYNIKINVQDVDNNNTYSFRDKLHLSSDEGFGQILMYEKQVNANKEIVLRQIDESTVLENKKIKLLFQYFHNLEVIELLKLKIENYKKKDEILFSDIKLDVKGFYSVDFEILDDYYGLIDVTLNISSDKVSKSLFIYNDKYDLWSQDINEVVGVMRYILPISEIKLMKEIDVDKKFEYISNFWNEKDPDKSTPENELLIEFIDRIKYVNLNFSDFNKGWKTDKGRIYIIYGAPESQNLYSSQSDGVYEIWTYPSGIKFTFLDRNGFGNFMLIKQGL